jgi:predicted nucleotidyltransferase
MISLPPAGLESDDWETLLATFSQVKDLDKVILFGSRALGNFKATSDIDLAIFSKTADTTLLELERLLDESPRFPLKVDILEYAAITNPMLKEHIDQNGIVVYQAPLRSKTEL